MEIIKEICLLILMLPIAYIDAKERRIPNKFIVVAVLLRGVLLMVELLTNSFVVERVVSEVLAVILMIIVTIACRLICKNGIGAGDFKLLMVMGMYLGIKDLWYAIVLSALIIMIIMIPLLLAKKLKQKDKLPLAPFLAMGTSLLFVIKILQN